MWSLWQVVRAGLALPGYFGSSPSSRGAQPFPHLPARRPWRISGAEAILRVKDAIADVNSIAPDLVCTIEDSVGDGHLIWTRVRARGTATGPFFGPPSGRAADTTVIDLCRVAAGPIGGHWGVPDG